MSEIKEFMSGSLNPKNLIDTITYNILFARDNPDYFYPSGIWVFCGAQGQGKTLSSVQCLKKMCKKYPKALVCSNMAISGIDNDWIEFTDYNQLIELTNGTNGIIFYIDEIHTLWNSLESKDIPISEMACFSQMRKDRRVILGTAQVYSRIAKPIREQLQYIIDCNCWFNLIQHNVILDPAHSVEKDGNVQCKTVCHKFWFHSPTLYNAYDTLNKILRLERKTKGVKKCLN